jgi:hypothetical protein
MARLEPVDPRPTVSLETKRLFESLMAHRIAGNEIPNDIIEALENLDLECAAFNRMVDESISQTGHVSAYRKVYLRNGKNIIEELPTGTHEKLIRRMDRYIDHRHSSNQMTATTPLAVETHLFTRRYIALFAGSESEA